MKGFNLCLVLLLGIINNSTAEEVKRIIYTGKVIDYNARPVEGATVVCYKSDYELNQRSYEHLKQVKTTSDGRFSLQVQTKDSSPVLVAGKQGLALGWWSQFGRAIEHTIRLGRPSQFKGTVVDPAGRPVPGARVRICLKNEMMTRDDIAPLIPEGWFTTRTDSNGQFLFDNVPGDSTADFGLEAPGMASMWTFCDFGPSQGEQFTAGRTDIRIVLSPEASIKGRVVDEHTGQVVAGVRILAIPYSRAGWYYCQDPVQTDPNGRFELTGLAPNKYLLRVISDKEGTGNFTVTVEPGQTVRDVRVSLSKGVPFEVRVYDLEKGDPIENASVTVTQKEAISRYTTFSQTVSTDANGLALLHVPPGECEIRAFKPSHGGTIRPQSVQLEPGQTLRHEVSLPRMACTLSGEVLDEQGRVLSGASVMHLTFGYHILSDANGQFEHSTYVTPLPSKVPVLVRHTPSGLGAVGVLRDPTKSNRFHGRIILQPAYVLTGRVTDPVGKSIPAAYVKLLMGRQSRLVTEVATDANGVYCIRSVPPEGDNLKDGYAIAACAEGFGLTQVNQIPFHNDTARPVHMEPIILLPADEVISGVVEDSNDQPVASVLVEVYGPRFSRTVSQPPCGKTLTDAQGRFRIAGVCKEPLRIYAKSPSAQRLTGQTWANGGSENVKVILGQKLIFSPSLIGKPLPELKDLRIDLSPTDTVDKIILVCFWDMQQRPSRNCIRELTKRAEELKEKGVAVIAVQASEVDENELNEWVKKYNIPFTIGIVQSDVEKTKFDWGVRSLPWLILIDRKHIVRAEGFNVDELDERLGQIAGTEPVMENNESTGPKLRTVRFPMSRSVGRLYVGELRLLDPHWWMGWQDAGPARGDVKVPVDKALRLDVTKEGLKELSALAACKPDDIQVVSFSYADVDDAGLGHLAGLTGLKMLVSPRVGDTGLAHISKLTSLISLILRRGTFTDDGLKYISNLSSLQRLDLGYTEVTDVGLVHLRGLSSLRYLGLDYNKSVSDAGFVHLRSLNSLERMTLYGTNITGSGFSHLEGISSLREILLNHSAITDEGLGDIAKLKSLEKLSLFNTKISDVGIVHLQALGSLRELSLSGTSVSDAGLDYIGRLTSLESLDLPDWTTDAGLLKLKGLKGLKQLDLGGTQMTGIGLEPLKAFELLESLRLPRGVSDKDLAIIKEFTLLEELSIHNSPITDVGMGYLTALKSLRKLTLSNVEVTDVGYAKLGELSNLEDLTILANRNRQEYAIGDQGLAGVAKLKGLKILYLRAPNLTDAGFKHLGKLRSLQEMELKEIKITDAGFVHIGRLRSLRRLWLPSSDICDVGLRHLAELNSLQDLSLQFSGGNTAGLLHLKSLRSLSQLIVSGVTFTEDSLQHLKEISPGLRSVHIGTEGISEEDAKRIEQQVPNCSIIVFAPLSIRRPLPPKPIPPHALVGKALPKFVGINIDFGPSQARDRMILVCFWDMQQRPSRNCIRELAKRAEELKEKGVAVIAVQASKVDENELNEWVKKYNIPFPVGMVQGNVEKTRFTWGVKSLPWLILTNWEQTVIAEGFGIDELDEELKKNIETEHAIQKNKATPTKPLAQTGLSDPAKSFLDAEAILAGWENIYAGIRTMRVSYCTRLVDYQPPAKNPDEPPPVKYQHIERVEDGKRYHIRYSIAEDGFDRPESLMEHAFDGKITREYWGSTKHGSIVAGLIGRNTETMNDLKVYMLLRRRLVGGRNASGTYLIEDPNSKPDLSRTLSYAIPRSMVSVLPKLEYVGSQLCHVIEVTVPGKDHKGIPRQIKQVFWMAHDKGMCLMKYQWYWDNTLDREIKVEQIAMAKIDGTDVWYPKKAYRTIFSDEIGTIKYELTVTEFIPNVEVDGKTFRFDFPKGTDVFDRVRGIAGVDLPKEPPSLVGKPIPELDGIKIDIPLEDTKSKNLLVCFWDMQQRPSRNCIRELAKRAEELKEKGIAVIAVQASKVDENELNEWVKKYNIPFPVGMVQGDVEKSHFTWGVCSLPWLILTDRKQIVRAEGFALTEIDEKISAIAQKQN